jgi:murein DD-endopeptidase MepM/ murein hydrolase activator NlpD
MDTSTDTAAIAEGRRWTEAFYSRKTAVFWDRLGPSLQKLFVDEHGIDAFRAQLDTQLGPELEVVEERVERDADAAVYIRVAKFTKAQERAVRVVVAMSHDTIVGFAIKPEGTGSAAPTTKLEYQTHASLRLPFDGEWYVAWGGRTIEQNQHVVMADQRFAYDFYARENGTTHRGDGTKNADYFCYGRPIVAPAAGRVIAMVDGIAENVPGQMDAKSPAGNYVLLEHGDGEYSLLAHLVPGSLVVKKDDRVRAGQVLGRCGNSGHSSEPHLHYHLQDGARVSEGAGLPAQFRDYVADGNVVPRGEPLRGQTIRAKP